MSRAGPAGPRVSAPAGVRVDAFVADSVAIVGGKLHVEGAGWNHLLVRRLPAVRSRIGLALLLRLPTAEAGTRQHPLAIRLEAPDGRPIVLGYESADESSALDRVEGTFSVEAPIPESPLHEQILPLALNFDELTLEQAGAYRFVIAIDGADAKIVSFAVATADLFDA